MHFFVGSTNPAKLNAIRIAVSQHWPDAVIEGFEVESGVSAQPMTDGETQTGAQNRAKAALQAGLQKFPDVKEALGVGLEGGVFVKGEDVYSTVWIVVIDQDGHQFEANGARFRLPKQIGERIVAGEQMGSVVSKLSNIPEVNKKQGMIGLVTQNMVTREEEYGSIAKLAIGLWHGRTWTTSLET